VASCHRNPHRSTQLSPPEQGTQREDGGLGRIALKLFLKPLNPVKYAADRLVVGGNVLWQTMCSEWANQCLNEREAKEITDSVKTLQGGHPLRKMANHR
jgi:hypothetical protein